MFKYGYKHIKYNCHPETCPHWEHYSYQVVRIKPLEGCSFKSTIDRVILQTDSEKECLEKLKEYGDKNIGYYSE